MKEHEISFINRIFNRNIKEEKLEVIITVGETSEQIDVTKEDFILLEDIRLYGMPYTIRTKAIRLENDGKGCITVDFKRH